MIPVTRLLRESLRCIQAGPTLCSKWRRLRFVPLSLWLRNPRLALLFVAVRPYTMLPYGRLKVLADLAERCNQENISGAFVQCGVWKGGSAAVLADVAERGDRRLFLFDSFQGCPSPGAADVSMHGRQGQAGEAAASRADVDGLFQQLGISHYAAWERWLYVIPCWFQATLPKVTPQIEQIALLHLDVDWYESTKVCMEYLYPLVANGGMVMIDDFFYWQGTRKAVLEYLGQGFSRLKTHQVDHTCIWFRKTPNER